jgi:uncharacterized protein
MKETYTLNADCFVLPYEEKGVGTYIAYFPLQSLIFEVNEDAAGVLNTLKKKPYQTEDPGEKSFLEDLAALKVVNNRNEPKPYTPVRDYPEPNSTILLLTDTCSLKCIYCYGQSKKTGTMMTLNVAKKAIDLIIANVLKKKEPLFHVGYHGGGEPTMNWRVLTESYYYALKQAEKNNLHLHTSICSNGVFSKEKALWLIKNIRDISISIDGTPEFHNKQRPLQNGNGSFDAVAATIDLFNEHKRVYNLRLTATELSYLKLPEAVNFLIERFKPRMIGIEPLYVCGRCETSGCKPPPLKDYIKVMIQVLDIGKKNNVNVIYSGNRLENLISRFCGAQGSNFFITPKGYVTACLEISELSDSRADFFIYGRYDHASRKFVFDNEKYKWLAGSQVQSFKTCKDCFAKWHCAGDCIAKSPDLSMVSDKRNEYRCELNKTLLRKTLLENMNQQIGLSESIAEVEPGILIPQKV